MNSSILDDIKKLLGIVDEYKAFDLDITIHINSTLSILYQLGALDFPYKISSPNDTWDDILGVRIDIEDVKSYIYLKVRMLFDPPTSSTVLESYKEAIKELEWRINVAVDPKEVSND